MIRAVSGEWILHAKIYVAEDAATLGSSNYSYRGLQAQAEANVASLGSQLAAQQQQLAQLHATASKVPEAEAELAQLNRDYDVIRKNYEQLVARREAASLGANPNRAANCAALGVTFQDATDNQFPGVTSGNENLKSEKAKTWTVGFIAQPHR